MTPNPFIRLFEAPVETLVVLGYVLLLVTLLIATLAACWSNANVLLVRWETQRPNQWEYVPPPNYVLRAAAIPFILAIDAWAISGIIYILT